MTSETPEERKLRESLKSKAVEIPANPSQDKLNKILDKAKKENRK